jgi:hypothetical protein
MLGAVITWASGFFKTSSKDEVAVSNDDGQKGLWALVDWDHYKETCTVFETANGIHLEAVLKAQHDYFAIAGVPVKNWTYSVQKPTEEPEGFRWIPLKAGYGLKVRI